MAGVDNTFTKNSTTGIQTPFNKTRYNKLTQQTASSCGPATRRYEPGARAILQHDGTSPALLTDCNPFVFILCKIIYVLLRLNVHNIHVIHMIEVKGSKNNPAVRLLDVFVDFSPRSRAIIKTQLLNNMK